MIELLRDYIPMAQTPISIGLIWFVWRIKANCLPTLRKEMNEGFKETGERVSTLEGRVWEHLDSSPGRKR